MNSNGNSDQFAPSNASKLEENMFQPEQQQHHATDTDFLSNLSYRRSELWPLGPSSLQEQPVLTGSLPHTSHESRRKRRREEISAEMDEEEELTQIARKAVRTVPTSEDDRGQGRHFETQSFQYQSLQPSISSGHLDLLQSFTSQPSTIHSRELQTTPGESVASQPTPRTVLQSEPRHKERRKFNTSWKIEGYPARWDTPHEYLLHLALNDPSTFIKSYINDLHEDYLWIIARHPGFSSTAAILEEICRLHPIPETLRGQQNPQALNHCSEKALEQTSSQLMDPSSPNPARPSALEFHLKPFMDRWSKNLRNATDFFGPLEGCKAKPAPPDQGYAWEDPLSWRCNGCPTPQRSLYTRKAPRNDPKAPPSTPQGTNPVPGLAIPLGSRSAPTTIQNAAQQQASVPDLQKALMRPNAKFQAWVNGPACIPPAPTMRSSGGTDIGGERPSNEGAPEEQGEFEQSPDHLWLSNELLEHMIYGDGKDFAIYIQGPPIGRLAQHDEYPPCPSFLEPCRRLGNDQENLEGGLCYPCKLAKMPTREEWGELSGRFIDEEAWPKEFKDLTTRKANQELEIQAREWLGDN